MEHKLVTESNVEFLLYRQISMGYTKNGGASHPFRHKLLIVICKIC